VPDNIATVKDTGPFRRSTGEMSKVAEEPEPVPEPDEIAANTQIDGE